MWKDLPDHSGNVLREKLSLAELFALVDTRLRSLQEHLIAKQRDVGGEDAGIRLLRIVDVINAIASYGKSEYNDAAPRIIEFKAGQKFDFELSLRKAAVLSANLNI